MVVVIESRISGNKVVHSVMHHRVARIFKGHRQARFCNIVYNFRIVPSYILGSPNSSYPHFLIPVTNYHVNINKG